MPKTRMPWLADVLRDAGLKVVEEPGWERRGDPFDQLALMIHHWGSAAASEDRVVGRHCYPSSPSLDPAGVGGGLRTDGRVNCNLFVEYGDGTIHVIAGGHANYSSGIGNRSVLVDCSNDIAPKGTAKAAGLGRGDFYGNRYSINVECEHAGDGGPMSAKQENAIMVMAAAIADKLGHTEGWLCGHNEFTSRKVDPRWNGSGNRMPTIREGVRRLLASGIEVPETPIPVPPQEVHIVNDLPTLKYKDGYNTGNPALRPWVAQLQVLLTLAGFPDSNTTDDIYGADGKYGPGTQAAVEGFQNANGIVVDGVCGPMTWRGIFDLD